MLTNAVTYTFAAEDADRAEAMFRELRDASRAERGCLRYDVLRGIDDRATFFLHEEYADRAALETHAKTEHFQRLGVNGIRTFATSRVGVICSPIA